MEPGLYLTFFKEGEPRERELPPVGPLEHVVLRDGVLLADRKAVHQTDQSSDANASSWIEAELELQRAMGNELGGARRPHLRVAATDGVYLRFASFGEFAEHNPAPELGPYAVVTVGSRGVEADGALLAIHTGSKRALWDLTSTAGKDVAGVVRPDIAFRSGRTSYHAGIRPAPLQPATMATPASVLRGPVVPPANPLPYRVRESVITSTRSEPAPAARPRATAAINPPEFSQRRDPGPVSAQVQYVPTVGSTLLNRMSTNARITPSINFSRPQSGRSLEWADALWRMRFVIIGALVVLVAVIGFVSFKNMPTAPSVNTVAVGKIVTGDRWDYTVGNVSRTTSAGNATSRGVYLVVRIGVRNQASEGAVLSPSSFSLVDSTGTEYPSLSESDSAYRSPGNTTGPYVWPKAFPVGQTVTTSVIFDIPASVTGLEFVIREVPTTRVRLD